MPPMKNNTMVIVGATKLDCHTQGVAAQQVDHQAWVYRLPMSAVDAAVQVITQLPAEVKQHIGTAIIASAQGDSRAKDRMMIAEKVQHKPKVRPSDALAATGATLPMTIMDQLPSVYDVFQVESACASSIKALELATVLAQTKEEVVLVAGIDFSTSAYVLYGFSSLGALAANNGYHAPFDQNRDGIAIGDGAATIAVCTQAFAEQHCLSILAVVDSVKSFSHCTHPTSPTDTTLLGNFLENVVIASGRSKQEFAYWDAHATATQAGDHIEFHVFAEMFADIPISSYKGHVGHCLSASGAIEIVNAIEHLQKGTVPATKGIITPMVDDPRIITQPLSTTRKTFIKCSFGFGGRNGAAVITVT